MTDLRTRMRIYDQAPAPDYWSEVELRGSSGSVGTAPAARSARPLLLLAAAVLLLTLTVGGAALALSRLVVPPPDSPADPSATPVASASADPSATPVALPSSGEIAARTTSWSIRIRMTIQFVTVPLDAPITSASPSRYPMVGPGPPGLSTSTWASLGRWH